MMPVRTDTASENSNTVVLMVTRDSFGT
jgi:hypothetical protein